MGSLNASGISVVSKLSQTFINRDGTQIYKTNSVTDVNTNLAASSEDRVISSGSIIRDNGTVVYTEDKVWGVHMGGRSSSARVPSKVGATRDLIVDRAIVSGVDTLAVIPQMLVPHIAQQDVRHLGNKVTIQQSVGDTLTERVSNSGTLG